MTPPWGPSDEPEVAASDAEPALVLVRFRRSSFGINAGDEKAVDQATADLVVKNKHASIVKPAGE